MDRAGRPPSTTASTGDGDRFRHVTVRSGCVPGSHHELMIAVTCTQARVDVIGRPGAVNLPAVEIRSPCSDLIPAACISSKVERRAHLPAVARSGNGYSYTCTPSTSAVRYRYLLIHTAICA